jgi:uncharacterized protein (DUF1499 family)
MRSSGAGPNPRLGWILLIALGCAQPGAEAKSPPLAPCPNKPNCVSSLAPDADHRVEPFLLSGAKGWAAARDAVAAMPRTTIIAEQPGYLHAECRSRIFRFVDDLELLRSKAGGRVDVRSASRVGYGDWGVNRARVASLRDALAAAGVLAENTGGTPRK